MGITRKRWKPLPLTLTVLLSGFLIRSHIDYGLGSKKGDNFKFSHHHIEPKFHTTLKPSVVSLVHTP